MKTALIPVITFCSFVTAQAQINFTTFPRNLQLYARDGLADTGTVVVSGTVGSAGSNYSGIRVKAYRNNSLLTILNQTLAFNGGAASFTLAYGIKAELAEYKFEALGVNGSSETLLRSADSIVCGDAYIVSGQSNAEAHSFAGSASANNSPFIRAFGYSSSGSDTLWRLGQGDGGWDSPGNTGQWGLRFARLIVDNHKMPVAIFNGATSGQPISFFQKSSNAPEDPNTNYGRLLVRLKKTGLASGVKALLWFQGEQDANISTTMPDYITAFNTLRSNWLKDYPSLKKFYVIQVGSYCINDGVNTATFPDHVNQIKEAHRRLGEELPDVQTLSSSGSDHYDDGRTYCHHPFAKGYEAIGNNAYGLLARDFYGKASDDIDPPTVKFAEASGTSEITLILKNILDSVAWNPGSETEFQIEGNSAKAASGKTAGNRIILALSGSSAGANAISYMGNHGWQADPLVRNRNGVGAVHFYKFPLTTAKYRDSASVATILKAIGSALPVDSVAVYVGQRITALRLGGRNMTALPADLGYMDSLKTLDLHGNALATLPREITKLPALASLNVDNNRLCGIPDSLAAWIDRRATDANWRGMQNLDATHSCSGVAVRREGPKVDPRAHMSLRMTQDILHIEMPTAAPGRKLLIVKQNGIVAARRPLEQTAADIDMRGWEHGLYILQVVTAGGNGSRKLLVWRGE